MTATVSIASDRFPDVLQDDLDLEIIPLKWANEVNDEQFKAFILIEGEYSLMFFNGYLKKQCTKINEITGAKLTVYKYPENVAVCVTQCRDIKLFGEVSFLLEKYMKNSETVVALQSEPISRYVSSDRTENLIRILRTDSYKIVSNVLPLETPNFVTSLSAGLYNVCDFNGWKAALYVYYNLKDGFGLDATEANKLKSLIELHGVTISCKPQTRIQDTGNLFS